MKAIEIEKAIAEEIAARSPFTAQDVYSAWELCRSFDLVLAGVEYCRVYGFINLSYAISRLTKEGGGMIQIFAIHQDGYREEITNLYWFEENYVKDWRGEGIGERFTFEVFVDGVLVWTSKKEAE